MLVSKISGTFWKLSKSQKYICNVIDHKVDNNVLQVCTYDFTLIQEAPMHHPQIVHKCPEFCWSFWSPWFWQRMAVGSAGFFLQCLDILSWLTLGDIVGSKCWWKEGNQCDSCSGLCKIPGEGPLCKNCCLLLLPHSCGCTTESITLEEAHLWKLFFPTALLGTR